MLSFIYTTKDLIYFIINKILPDPLISYFRYFQNSQKLRYKYLQNYSTHRGVRIAQYND